MNCIDLIESTWFNRTCTSFWWGQSTNRSYLSKVKAFKEAELEVEYLKKNMLEITRLSCCY